MTGLLKVRIINGGESIMIEDFINVGVASRASCSEARDPRTVSPLGTFESGPLIGLCGRRRGRLLGGGGLVLSTSDRQPVSYCVISDISQSAAVLFETSAN